MGRRVWTLSGAIAAVGIVTALLGGAAGAANGGRPFDVVLSGANEFNAAGQPINPHGDADRGSIRLRLNPGQEEVCWSLGDITLTSGDALPHVAHIHEAPAGVAGPVVVNLFGGAAPAPAPTAYPTDTTCVPADRADILEIIRDPSSYYVNLHNAQHPGGVMRGQLAR